MSKLKCPKCGETREASSFQNATSKKTNYWCGFCVKDMQAQNKHSKDELFKRKTSECDSKLADRRLANELKEVWEIE